MKYEFDSPQEMLNTIQSNVDLYCPEEELYVFNYNDDGAICSYRISIFEAKELQRISKVGFVSVMHMNNEISEEYWSAFLGLRGSIYDDPSDDYYDPDYCTSNLDFCKQYYRCEWIDCEDVLTMQGD